MAARKKKAAPPAPPPPMEKLSPAPVALLFGSDEYLISRNARELVDRWCPPAEQTLGLEIIEGQEAGTVGVAVDVIKRGMEALQTVGLFGGRKLVWMRDLLFLSQSKVAQSDTVKGELDKLVQLLKSGMPPDVQLILSGAELDKRSALYRICKEVGHALEYAVPEKSYQAEAQAQERATALMKEVGLSASPSWIERFVAKAGLDTRMLAQEVEKLKVYLGDRDTVEADDIRIIVSPGREASSWDFEDALGNRDLSDALALLRQLLFQGESEIALIHRMEGRFRDLLIVRECMQRGWCGLEGSGTFAQLRWKSVPEAELVCEPLERRDPRKLNPYRGGRLAQQTRSYSRRELMAIHRQLIEAHEALVSSSLPKALVLELLVVRIVGKAA